MTTEPDTKIEQQIEDTPTVEQPGIEPTPTPVQEQPPTQAVTAFEAGQFAARVLLRQQGRPNAVDWFVAHAPDVADIESVMQSGRPVEFWAGMHSEIKSVAGTA